MKNIRKKFKGALLGVAVFAVIFFLLQVLPDGSKISDTLGMASGLTPAAFVLMPVAYGTSEHVCPTEPVCTDWDYINGCTHHAESPLDWCATLVEQYFFVFLMIGLAILYAMIGQLIYEIYQSRKNV